MSLISLLLHGLSTSRRMMVESTRGLSPAMLASRPSEALRSCGEILGAAAIADREVLRYLRVTDLPFVPEGFEARFARWGSGESQETRYHGSLPAIFATHRDALIRAVERLAPDDLDQRIDPRDHLDEETVFGFGAVGEMILIASAYTHFLVGEASVVRVALGLPEVPDPLDDPGPYSVH